MPTTASGVASTGRKTYNTRGAKRAKNHTQSPALVEAPDAGASETFNNWYYGGNSEPHATEGTRKDGRCMSTQANGVEPDTCSIAGSEEADDSNDESYDPGSVARTAASASFTGHNTRSSKVRGVNAHKFNQKQRSQVVESDAESEPDEDGEASYTPGGSVTPCPTMQKKYDTRSSRLTGSRGSRAQQTNYMEVNSDVAEDSDDEIHRPKPKQKLFGKSLPASDTYATKSASGNQSSQKGKKQVTRHGLSSQTTGTKELLDWVNNTSAQSYRSHS